ncbi:MAG TPA: IscS subfamily cysteine desulfurase [Chitinophagales bacterium]|nr:IscS subfamily cysteine desulfurase [Chitinophagales bacterium]
MKLPIYLDYNSTTPVDYRVLEAMLPYFSEKFGNAASKTHRFGWIAEEAVEKARSQVAALINAESSEIIFTSGATEAVNLSLKGSFEAYRSKGNHIITVSTEHKAVLDCCKKLEKQGATVTYLPVNSEGLIELKELENAITEKTVLICVMFANNEIGVLQPVSKIAEMAHRHSVIFMCDATQAIGKVKVDVQESHIDLMPLSAHKIYGPKGAGALYVRRKNPRVSLIAQMDGGGHERNLRSGTLNVPGIIGLGKACEIAGNELQLSSKKIRQLRDRLQHGLEKNIPGTRVNGSMAYRLPNTLNVSFKNTESHVLMKKLINELAVSSGSACTSAVPEPSYVLKALGLDDKSAYASVRFSLGKPTTEEEIDYVVKRISAEVEAIRKNVVH